jgi:hypothetical protein
VDGNFPRILRSEGQLFGLVGEAGTYWARLSSGKTVEVTIPRDEVPPALTLGPGWDLEAVGKDKNRKEYKRFVHLAELKDWTLIQELRHFSGKGRYWLDFDLDGKYVQPDLSLDLSLGAVKDVVEVWVNQKHAATLLARPYRVNMAPYVQPGRNHLEIVVVNSLRNQIVGEGLTGDPYFVVFKQRLFFLESGLSGPVRLIPARRVLLH